jgi:glucose-6-phosphate isomerase
METTPKSKEYFPAFKGRCAIIRADNPYRGEPMNMWENESWNSSMKLGLDTGNAAAESLGDAAFSIEGLSGTLKRLDVVKKAFLARADSGEYGFPALPLDDTMISESEMLAAELEKKFDDLVLLGIGGSALGPRALLSALGHPYHNTVDKSVRGPGLRLHVMENVDPVTFASMISTINLQKACFVAVTKSGSTVETMSQFMIARSKLIERFGFEGYRQRMIAVTDPRKGTLRKIVEHEKLASLTVPPNVGGRFSVLCPVGLLPAAAVGIDIRQLCAGAAAMEKVIRSEGGAGDPASMLAALFYEADTSKKRNMLVMMPYADALLDFAEWFQQLWAESLGKKVTVSGRPAGTGSTPVRALGVTDQHSQLQMYVEGPQDKLIAFLTVDRFSCEVTIPKSLEEFPDVAYLGGNTLNRLIAYEQEATEQSLLAAGKPSIRIAFPEINAYTVGQFIMLCEFATVLAGGLYDINPFDQPGVEHGKNIMYKKLGKPGY